MVSENPHNHWREDIGGVLLDKVLYEHGLCDRRQNPDGAKNVGLLLVRQLHELSEYLGVTEEEGRKVCKTTLGGGVSKGFGKLIAGFDVTSNLVDDVRQGLEKSLGLFLYGLLMLLRNAGDCGLGYTYYFGNLFLRLPGS